MYVLKEPCSGDLRARQITSAAGAHTTQAALCIFNVLVSYQKL